LDQVKRGQTYQRIALEAAKINLNTHVRAAPIQIGNFYQKVQKVLKLRTRPQVLFRLGYTLKKQPHSPRLSGEKVTKK
jgi:hypothetical protein